MSFKQIHITLSSEHIPQLEEDLLSKGALSISFRDAYDEPILEPELNTNPLWSTSILTALFDKEVPLKKIKKYLEKKYPSFLKSIEIEDLKDQIWERAWLEYFKPMSFTERLWICPKNTLPPDPGATNIFLDPGLAFGTGTHPTTELCLIWLASQNLSEKIVMDYGCGSGILGIAALKLGAKKVYAIDHDPQALEASADNAEFNELNKENFSLHFPPDLSESIQADIIIANILASPLIALSKLFYTHLKKGGLLVLSGILENQVKEVLEAYTPLFKMSLPFTKEGWVRLEGEKI